MIIAHRSPAKAGAQAVAEQRFPLPWTPAFAGARKCA